ncbi:MAG: T9SS type A sorting domain-containing protein, partial [Bacteroidota bacterium]
VGNNDDCNDENGDINPDAIEIVDGEDNDCNGLTDDVVSTEELNSVFRVYPNPAHSTIVVEMENGGFVSAQIINPVGQILKSFDLDISSGSSSIALNNLPGGLYYLRLLDNEGVTLGGKKFLKL